MFKKERIIFGLLIVSVVVIVSILTGCCNDIKYDDLAKNPQEFKTQKVDFSGQILSIVDQNGVTNALFAVDNDRNNLISVIIADKVENWRDAQYSTIKIIGVAEGETECTLPDGDNVKIPCVRGMIYDFTPKFNK